MILIYFSASFQYLKDVKPYTTQLRSYIDFGLAFGFISMLSLYVVHSKTNRLDYLFLSIIC